MDEKEKTITDSPSTDEMELKDSSLKTESEPSSTEPSDDELYDSLTGDASEDSDNSDNSEESEQSELVQARAESAQYQDKYLRLMAEFDNYRKRMLQEKSDLILNGGSRVIESLLPILDDFDRALANMETEEDISSLKKGISLIIDKLIDTLGRQGLKKMDVLGKPFDTDYQEAIAMVPGMPDSDRGKVIDCVQPGYMLNDKVLRHAKVAVAE